MKKLILSLLMLCCISAVSFAQSSMTDDQVLEYVKTESKKGTSQQKIVTDLMKKGVNTAQLQRVRHKATQMQATANEEAKGNASVAAKDVISSNSSKIRAMETGVDSDVKSESMASEQMSGDIAEISKEDQRQVFGRNIFSQINLTFQPSGNMATPQNYTLGPGDKVSINVWGASQTNVEETISADGYIVVPNVGQIKLAGLSVAQAKATIRSRIGSKYGGSSIDMSVTNIRTIQVQVMGEVNAPGTYSLSGLSSAFNALYTAGGISKIGTLRNIQVFRSGKKISTIDVYDYILNGNAKCDVRLRDNDVIVVGAYEALVEVTGNVKRPMWYEMKKTETASDLIRFCGGFNGDAYTKSLRVLRKSGSEYSIHTIDEFQMGAFKMADEDRVEVDSIRAKFSNIVEVKGAAKHSGQFELGGNIQTVKELLLAADGLSEDAYTKSAIIHRQKDDLSLEMVSVDIEGILNGTATDIPLKNNDVLFIPSKTEMKGNQTVTISGFVNYPGSYPFAENTTMQDLILEAGGISEGGSLAKVDVFRRVRDSRATETSKITAEVTTFSLDENFQIIGDTVFYFMPYDMVVVHKSPSYAEQRNVTVSGEANFEGSYAMDKRVYRLSDLIKACGGVTNEAYVYGAHLTRHMTDEEIDQRDEANKKKQIALYENALRNSKDIDMNLAQELIAAKQESGTTYPVAINLAKALENPNSDDDLILREGDRLDIPELTNTIKISGEVLNPISVPYDKTTNLYSYINQAGGYTNTAKRSGVYGIQANGTIVRLHSNSVHDIKPGMEIVVPQKHIRKEMTTGEWVSIGSSIISMGAIVTSLINILKK